MSLQNALDRYFSALKSRTLAQQEVEAAEKNLFENAPFKVGDKVLVSYQNKLIEDDLGESGFVTEVEINFYQDTDGNLFRFTVRRPTKAGAFSDRTKVITYQATPKDLQPFP